MTGDGGVNGNNSNKTLNTHQININTVNSETLCSEGATQRDSSFSSMVIGSAASQFNKLPSNNMSILNSNTSTS
jgi:hypothetical protein